MTAFRDSARIFRIADIIGYIEVFCMESQMVQNSPGFHRRMIIKTAFS